MNVNNFYVLPRLDYGYKSLEPYISERQLILHHQKHHQAYVDEANALLNKIDQSNKEKLPIDLKSVLKSLSFNVGGHLLHSLFWQNLTPAKNQDKPSKFFEAIINQNFGSYENFKKKFSETALKTEGSGWAALTFCLETKRLLFMQIEKHNVNLFPLAQILLVLDVWEHAYYLDYENNRSNFISSFWNLVNWKEVEFRLKKAKKI